jgi:hypothetical protein
MQTVHIGIMLNWNNNKKHIHNHMLAMLERQVALCDHKRVFMFVHLNLLFRMMKMCKINWLLLITTRTIVVSRRTGMKRGCQMTKLVVYQWSVCHLNCFLERKKMSLVYLYYALDLNREEQTNKFYWCKKGAVHLGIASYLQKERRRKWEKGRTAHSDFVGHNFNPIFFKKKK